MSDDTDITFDDMHARAIALVAAVLDADDLAAAEILTLRALLTAYHDGERHALDACGVALNAIDSTRRPGQET